MTALQYAFSDTLVLAKRSLKRIPRQPDLLIGFTAASSRRSASPRT